MSGGIYMVSAQKPTAVTHSILGRITSELDLNLVICKSTLLEIYRVTKEGLKFVRQISLWGVVENLKIVKVKNDRKDSILITTCKYDVMVLSCELNSDGVYDIVTRSHGNIKDVIPRTSSAHMIAIVDSAHHLVAIKCYDGLLKTFPIYSDNKQIDVSTLRMNDLNVIDMTFLHGYDNPTLAYISKVVGSKESGNSLSLKAYEIDQKNKEFSKLLSSREIFDNQAFLIQVPEPYGGVLVVGTQSISYSSLKSNDIVQKAPSFLSQGEITNFAPIDPNGQRYLLSNTMGELFLMVLVDESTSSARITDIRFEHLGQTALADNITYIDNGVVFIGSRLGDSQLIKLIETSNENGSFINIMETYTNLGPILDMLIVDIEKQGQGQLITCSGGHKNGSLRVIRSGIGIHESANIELAGVKALWPLRLASAPFDDHLVLSFYSYTKIFSFYGEEFEDVEPEGFDLQNQTIHCANVSFNQIVQITSTSIRLLKRISLGENEADTRLVAEWRVPEGEFISNATCNMNEILLAYKNQLNYLTISDGSLNHAKSKSLEHEIACLDLGSLNEENRNVKADICAVGLWNDISARILTLPDLEQIINEQLKRDVIPRSIIIETLEQISYLFVSFGDGSVISYVMNTKSSNFNLSERRKVVLGTQPTILKKFVSQKRSNIFACSDRPSVISSTNQKLVYSSVNLKQVDYMCELNSHVYKHSLALLSSGVLRIGTMDSIQKLHIRTVHLNETARRIAYQAETQTFGVLTVRLDAQQTTTNNSLNSKPLVPCASTQCASHLLAKNGSLVSVELQTENSTLPSTSKEESQHVETQCVNSFLLLNQNTFEVLHSVQFMPNEFATSILSTTFDQADSNYYVIGCSIVNDDDPEPKVGRIVVLKYHENKLIHVCEKEVKGSPYNLINYNGKLLATISNSLKLYEFKENHLNLLASQSDHVFLTHVKCKNDFILAGDMMKSCTVYTYRADSNQFETVAKDYSPLWLSSIEILDDDTFLMSDSLLNLILLRKDSGQSNEEDRKTLQNAGCIHLGEQINIFRHGSLVMQEQQSANELLQNHVQGSVLAGTVSGSIVLFTQLSASLYKILNELQARLGKFLLTAGKIEYSKWRDFETEKRVESFKSFIDGDLIEAFLELTPNEASNLIKDFRIDSSTLGHNGEEFSVSYFNKLIEELSRLH